MKRARNMVREEKKEERNSSCLKKRFFPLSFFFSSLLSLFHTGFSFDSIQAFFKCKPGQKKTLLFFSISFSHFLSFFFSLLLGAKETALTGPFFYSIFLSSLSLSFFLLSFFPSLPHSSLLMPISFLPKIEGSVGWE